MKSAHLLKLLPLSLLTVLLPATAVADTNYATPYYFSTLAGTSSIGSNDGPGTGARFYSPRGVAVDHDGNVYVADAVNDTIRKITPDGMVFTLAGTAGVFSAGIYLPGPMTPQDIDGTGANAKFGNPEGIAIDAAGTIYVADKIVSVIRKITPDGVVTTWAGYPQAGGTTDGAGTAARFFIPVGLAADSTGNIYVADWGNHLIRKITPAGAVTTLANFSFLYLAVDRAGNVYVPTGDLIKKITPDGVVSTLAGSDFGAGSADGVGTAARFHNPSGIAVDPTGNLYVSDSSNFTLRKITPQGLVTTVAGSPGLSGSADGAGGAARFRNLSGLACDDAGNIYAADEGNNTIRKITPAGVVSTLAGLGLDYAVGNNDGLPGFARFQDATQVAAGPGGTVYVADTLNHTIRQISPAGFVTTVAGSSTGSSANNDDGPGPAARFAAPGPIAVDQGSGAIYVGETDNGTIRKITSAQLVSTLNPVALGNTQFDGIGGIGVDSSGTVYVTDSHKHTVNKISAAGAITLLAGSSGAAGAADGSGSAAGFNQPAGITADPAGNLYVADAGNDTIRKITPAGAVTTFAGAAGLAGTSDGPASEARFDAPSGVALDPAGNLFVADSSNSVIRKIAPDGTVSTVAGRPRTKGIADGSGSAVRFSNAAVIAVDAMGSILVSNASTIQKGQLPGPPAFDTQPQSQTVVAGSSVLLSAAATGAPAPTYQWQLGGANLSGATNNSYLIANVSAVNAGTYSVVASNSAGTATSGGVTLTVVPGRPATQTVTSGHSASLDAGSVTGSLQWQVSPENGTTWTNLANDSTYSGVTTATLGIANAGTAQNNARYRLVSTTGSSVATSAPTSLTVAPVVFPFPTSIAVDPAGNLYLADAHADTIQKISPAGQASLLAGTAGTAGSTDGAGPLARFNQPGGLALLPSGTLLVADTANATIRRLAVNGTVTTLAGATGARGNADGAGPAATFSNPVGLGADSAGNLFVADSMNATIRKIDAGGAVRTFAGLAGSTGSADGTGSAARFNLPTGLAIDGGGSVFVSDSTNNTVRKITPGGLVTTLAGVPGVAGSSDGTGAAALFNHPGGLAMDSAGNLYLADTGNSTIRKITAGGAVTTVAGLPGVAGLEDGTGSAASFALFNQPQALCADSAGNLFVADTGNAAVRRIDSTGNVTTLALTPAPLDSSPGSGGSTGGTGSGSGGSGSGGGTTGTSGGNGNSPAPASSGGGGGAMEAWFALVALGLGATGVRKKLGNE